MTSTNTREVFSWHIRLALPYAVEVAKFEDHFRVMLLGRSYDVLMVLRAARRKYGPRLPTKGQMLSWAWNKERRETPQGYQVWLYNDKGIPVDRYIKTLQSIGKYLEKNAFTKDPRPVEEFIKEEQGNPNRTLVPSKSWS